MLVKKQVCWFPISPDGEIFYKYGGYYKWEVIETFFLPSKVPWNEAKKIGWKIMKCVIVPVK